jgi:hypothetical protein
VYFTGNQLHPQRTFCHNVSTTKYFFADLPTALAAAFFVLMLIRWLKAQHEDNYRKNVYAVLTGGALGMMTLIRTQSLSLISSRSPFCLAGPKSNSAGVSHNSFFLPQPSVVVYSHGLFAINK